MILELVLAASAVAVPPACSWAHPGANPYRGGLARALADFDMPAATRQKLRTLMARHRPTDEVTITRDAIAGRHDYADLREMHSGHGKLCHGPVDRSAWSERRQERARVYCADDVCVIVPVICNNVSLVTRKPEHEAALDDSPIDIEPAAGPGPAGGPPGGTAQDALLPGEFIPGPVAAAAPPAVPGDLPPASGGSLPGDGVPIGGTPCCDSEPIGPGAPVSPPAAPPPAVPERPNWLLLLAGRAAVALPFRPRPAPAPRPSSGGCPRRRASCGWCRSGPAARRRP